MFRFRLTRNLRKKLKEPFGRVISGPEEEVDRELRKAALVGPEGKIICVGDAVSRKFVKLGLPTNLKVVDNKEMRRKLGSFNFKAKSIFKVKNPRGTIGFMAWQIMKEAMKKEDALILVDGEEDLLTLAAICLAPLGSKIFYGQPKVGVVMIEVNERKKEEVRAIISMMKLENLTSPINRHTSFV